MAMDMVEVMPFRLLVHTDLRGSIAHVGIGAGDWNLVLHTGNDVLPNRQWYTAH